ncbi:MAG TPA: MMPL family transporter, partial [Candidatus Methanoperedens sp.]|nr:MMPL family transporter [Candidatus Methanoperedens sp.]
TLVSIAPTIALAGCSTVIGFASLLANDTPILREFGWITSVGIAASMFVAVTFVPACLVLMRVPTTRARAAVAGGLTAALLARLARFNEQRRFVSLAVGALLVLGALAAYPRLSIETNVVNFFKRDDPVRATIGRVSTEFGGTITIRTIVEAPGPDTILRPEYLREMEAYQTFLEGFDRVGKTLSIADLIKDMNMAIHEGDPAFNVLPATLEEAERYLFLYALSSDPDEFDGLIDAAHGKATVTARLRQVNAGNEALGTGETKRILAAVEQYLAAHFSPELRVTPTGRAQDIVRTSDYIVRGLIRGMLTAVVPIWLLVSLIFRSPAAGLFGIMTTAIGLLLNFGVMGWFGIPLDIATTLIASIAIGIGVDDAVHYLLRLRRTMRGGVTDPARAMTATLAETGRTIVFTSVTMALGFSIFMVASFRPVVFFGGLTALSMVTTSVAALLVVPVLLLLVRPRFLTRGVPALPPGGGSEIDIPPGRP